MRDDREKLQDNLETIDRIERYSTRCRQVFEEDELIQSWFVQNLQVIGEAARALSMTTRSLNPKIPWSEIIGMRNILAHNYFAIDLELVWAAIERDTPDLKHNLEIILQNL